MEVKKKKKVHTGKEVKKYTDVRKMYEKFCYSQRLFYSTLKQLKHQTKNIRSRVENSSIDENDITVSSIHLKNIRETGEKIEETRFIRSLSKSTDYRGIENSVLQVMLDKTVESERITQETPFFCLFVIPTNLQFYTFKAIGKSLRT